MPSNAAIKPSVLTTLPKQVQALTLVFDNSSQIMQSLAQGARKMQAKKAYTYT